MKNKITLLALLCLSSGLFCAQEGAGQPENRLSRYWTATQQFLGRIPGELNTKARTIYTQATEKLTNLREQPLRETGLEVIQKSKEVLKSVLNASIVRIPYNSTCDAVSGLKDIGVSVKNKSLVAGRKVINAGRWTKDKFSGAMNMPRLIGDKVTNFSNMTFDVLCKLGFAAATCKAFFWIKGSRYKKIKIPVALIMLNYLRNSVIKAVESEKYLQNGIGQLLQLEINANLSRDSKSKKDSDIQKWFNGFSQKEKASLKAKITAKLNSGSDPKNISDPTEKNEVIEKLDRDIKTLGNKVLSPTIWEMVKNIFLWRSVNGAIHNVYTFEGPQILGQEWSIFHNILTMDIRHGSAAYISKLIKLMLLREIIK